MTLRSRTAIAAPAPQASSQSPRTIAHGRLFGGKWGGIKTPLVIALAVVAVGVVGLLAVRRGEGAGKLDSLELHKASKTSFDITVTANGELEAKRQTEIRSKLEAPAAIVEVVAEGIRVTKGDQLVRLNTDTLQSNRDEELLRVESARSELTGAENNYLIQVNENDASLRQAQLKLELATIDLNKWIEGDDRKQRQLLDLAIDRTERELVRLGDKAQETHKLHEKGFASRDDLLLDDKNLAEAEANSLAAKLDKVVYEEFEVPKQMKKLTSDVEEAKAELERVGRKNESQLTSKEADRINKRRSLQIREEKLAKYDEQIANAVMLAPTDGLVVYASSTGRGRGFMMGGGDPIQIGRTIQPNDLIIVLPETGQMVSSVRVHESLAGRIRPGLPATIRIDALGNQTFAGTVDSIGVLAESDNWRDPNLREYTVKIDLDPSSDVSKLKPAMRCESEIVLGAVKDTLAVPVQAIFREGAMSYVYTPVGAKFERRPVLLGRRSSLLTEVLPFPADFTEKYGMKAIAEGDQVLLREPAPGEVLNTKLDEKALAALGPARGGPGGMPGGGRPAGQGPNAARAGGDAKKAGGPTGAKTLVLGADGKPVAGDAAKTEEVAVMPKDGATPVVMRPAPGPEGTKDTAKPESAPAAGGTPQPGGTPKPSSSEASAGASKG